MENYQAAYNALSNAIRLHPNNVEYYLSRASISSNSMDKARLLSDCSIIDRKNPENIITTFYRSKIDFFEGRYEECKQNLDKIKDKGMDTYAYITYTVVLYILQLPYQGYADGLKQWFSVVEPSVREEYKKYFFTLVEMVKAQRKPDRLLEKVNV